LEAFLLAPFDVTASGAPRFEIVFELVFEVVFAASEFFVRAFPAPIFFFTV